MPNAIEVTDLWHEYRKPGSVSTPVLKRISFSVKSGEFICIAGPSGCGKTTLLHLMASFLPIQRGGVLLNQKPIDEPCVDRVLISQESSLFPWKTVLDNVAFGLKANGIAAAERRERAGVYLELVGIQDFAGFYPNQLSGGMRQRVALARALVVQPAVLLLDEPLASLDWQSRQQMQERLLDIWSTLEQTIVMVTHDIEEAIFLADRIFVLGSRPSSIRKEFDVAAPRPRDDASRYLDSSLSLRQEICNLL